MQIHRLSYKTEGKHTMLALKSVARFLCTNGIVMGENVKTDKNGSLVNNTIKGKNRASMLTVVYTSGTVPL